MFDISSINWNEVGGDNLPCAIAPEVNEAKASMLILDLYNKGEIKRYAGEKAFYKQWEDVFKCNISIDFKLQNEDIDYKTNPSLQHDNKLISFQIVNGIPTFPLHCYEPNNSPSWIAKVVPSDFPEPFSLFKLIRREPINEQRNSSRYSEVEHSLHFFNADPRPLGSFSLESKRFHLSHLRLTSPEEETEPIDFQEKVFSLFKCGYQDLRNFSLDLCVNRPGLSFYVCFRDEYGSPQMGILKFYYWEKNRFYKYYIPITCWHVKHKNTNEDLITNYYRVTTRWSTFKLFEDSYFLVATGLPKKQPLYNLDILEGAETIVVCNSPENAEALQNANDIEKTGVAFTGFICDPYQYDEVDFSPLKDKSNQKRIYLEISNHNGLSMAESCLEVNALYEYLRDKEGITDIRFILRAIEYPNVDEVCNLDELVKTAGGKPPKVDDSIMELDREQFEIILRKACEEIERKKRESHDKPFWRADQDLENKGELESEDEEDTLIMRPILNRGMATMIVGEPYIGKTAFAMAMGAYLSGCKNHFLENWYWTRRNKESLDEKSTRKKEIDYKVVYLYFDSGGSTLLNQYMDDFCPGINKNNPLFVLEDMSGNTIDYSSEENYGRFLQLLTKYEKDGKSIDVLFIDTAARFANQDRFDFKKLNQFISSFNSDRKDIALVFTHHSKLDKPEEAYGGAIAYASIRNSCILFRTNKQKEDTKGTPTLNNPFSVKVKKSVSSAAISSDLEVFNAFLYKNKFLAYVNAFEQAKRLREIVNAYEARGFNRPKIASLLDISTKTLFNHLAAANEVINNPSQYQDVYKFEDKNDD